MKKFVLLSLLSVSVACAEQEPSYLSLGQSFASTFLTTSMATEVLPIVSAIAGSVGGGLAGSAIGAIGGACVGDTGPGAALGGMIGAGTGAFVGTLGGFFYSPFLGYNIGSQLDKTDDDNEQNERTRKLGALAAFTSTAIIAKFLTINMLRKIDINHIVQNLKATAASSSIG